MKERPIIFSAPMVRAILDGRKTQTRRILRPPKWSTGFSEGFDQAGKRYAWINLPLQENSNERE